MTPPITLSTFWAVTLLGTWLVASSQHLDLDLLSLLSPGGSYPPGQIQLDRFPEGFNFN